MVGNGSKRGVSPRPKWKLKGFNSKLPKRKKTPKKDTKTRVFVPVRRPKF